MLAIIIEFEIRPERGAEFEVKLRHDATETLRDDGCLRMEVFPVRGEPNRMVLSELWRDEAAIEAHRNKPGHSHAWQDALISGKRVLAGAVLPSTVSTAGR